MGKSWDLAEICNIIQFQIRPTRNTRTGATSTEMAAAVLFRSFTHRWFSRTTQPFALRVTYQVHVDVMGYGATSVYSSPFIA